jgi:asparagine synthase (glutamine-hydrolysing)
MCGICSILRFEKGATVDPVLINTMSESLMHRGPDDGGLYVNGRVGLGHRRLSIIDIAGGRQPMESHGTGFPQVIVYNGEIYNYLELRRELQLPGHTFKTQSDTEVLLTAYGQWGHGCTKRLRGMFAFAIWDKNNQTLFLARDRMGIKPLYYHLDRNGFVFSSEVRAIQRSSPVQTDLDQSVLDAFLTLGYIPGPRTLFKGIRKLIPGHAMTVTVEGEVKSRCYWNFNSVQPATLTFADAVKRLRELLEHAVQMRLMSDVPLGVFLSGGLDSSAITALMSQLSGKQVKTFSIGYDTDDEVI